MKIISWNVNGIRAVLKKGFCEWISNENPDIVCLQEVKAFENQIPQEIRYTFRDYNYIWHTSNKPGYAGTALFYKKNIDTTETKNAFKSPTCFNDDGRVTSIERNGFVLLNIYFPNGGTRADGTPMLEYKLNFYDKYIDYISSLVNNGKKVITTGDFNICHTAIDIARPKENENSIGFLPIERQKMDQLEQAGFIDVFRTLNPETKEKYTWWSYRAGARPRNIGWRLDYFWISKNCQNNIIDMVHYDTIEGSDHCPIGLFLK